MSIPHPTQTQMSSGCTQEITESVVALVSSSDPTLSPCEGGAGGRDEDPTLSPCEGGAGGRDYGCVCVCAREIVTASEF